MHVGIITFHCSYNFGSALQAYALQTAISSIVDDVKIVDYRSRDFNQYHIIRPLRPWRIPGSVMNLGRLIDRKKAFRTFSDKYFRLTNRRYSYLHETRLFDLQDQFDAFVCGSDQIWNLDCTNGVVEPFFLSFAGSRRRIAYAPSLAHTSFKSEHFDRKKVSALLGQFDFISVREEETLPLFQPLVEREIKVAVDPTLLLRAESYRDMVSKRTQKESYIFVYLLRSCPELIESAEMMSEILNMKVYYISEHDFPIRGAMNLFGLGPEGFLSLIAHAEVVLTNSFHATVFSILFHKPFRTFATDSSASRMRSLLGELEISDRCADGVDARPIGGVDWDTVDLRLGRLRATSWDYLRGALA